ncbi:hypothetical protein NPS01_03560 [Nocardioides psychrotolerans]|uniref:Protein N-acetyltransferase, RimJ/RimL family n=1 Tax=Nocardioides psychrotolerans TaxID=1005945 RepID=A0A1I3BDU9_9ACTN|nr:GNAT family N-acetyltransferase [Nocardioides psychrotolerans]GEP36693.1 hypothetical protein NPS01_03560 [Nocardioides psychrotolerans]SFH60473.1 Protein N-acetyltransferase, RimJ/RimL family [Nocardioides psychrotolerans]
MSLPPTLTDGVVTLRAHLPADAAGVVEQCRDPLSQRWTAVPVPYTQRDAETYVSEVCPVGWLSETEWAFAVEAEGRFAGTVSLRNEGHRRAELAYGAHPWARGTGHLERAVRLLLDYGFTEHDLTTVVWWTRQGNWASRKLAWKVGIEVEGAVRRWVTQRGESYPSWVGTLLREDTREPRSAWLDCPVLVEDGVRLRPIVAADATRIQEACSEARTQHWLGQLPSPYAVDDALAYVETRTQQLAEATGVTWAVTAPHDDVLLATIGWFNRTADVECEIGYWTHPDARGRGLMTRATGVVTRHVVDTLGVARVTAFAAVDNTASRRVIEANGFTQYGVERLGIQLRDARADMALYDVLAGEVPPLTR